jgi:23S rRNA U2552 (ribose-2'-O)-methylase RlmE/FtsJ
MANWLRDYFYSHTIGQGIWKWDHYFEIYDRHFNRFRGQEVHILEIGIYSGGSLNMWRDYFGPKALIYGVDIEASCKSYERDDVKIFIGDQTNRDFWRHFRSAVPKLDIVVDDGGHEVVQQTVSLDELLPHLRPGGVYLCEDVHGYPNNEFASYVHKLAHGLNDHREVESNPNDNDRRLVKKPTPFQAEINSIHLYPYVIVIEKNGLPIKELIAPKRGTEWQPFLK